MLHRMLLNESNSLILKDAFMREKTGLVKENLEKTAVDVQFYTQNEMQSTSSKS